jgi:hypothetical protein
VPAPPEEHSLSDPTADHRPTKPQGNPINSENASPQFINSTNSVSLNKSARTQIRAQVMRDYHRRRLQAAENEQGQSKDAQSHEQPPSARSQVLKFRLGKEKVLRPWVPVKAARINKTSSPGGKDKESRKAVPNPRFKPVSFNSVMHNEVNGVQWMSHENAASEGNISTLEPLDRWLSVLDLALRSSALGNSPSSGALDPFSTTALLITPRTQLLLHHYCKF